MHDAAVAPASLAASRAAPARARTASLLSPARACTRSEVAQDLVAGLAIATCVGPMLLIHLDQGQAGRAGERGLNAGQSRRTRRHAGQRVIEHGFFRCEFFVSREEVQAAVAVA